MAAKWPNITVRERVGDNIKQHFWTAETEVPCGKTLTRTANGYDRDRVKARAENDIRQNAKRHVRTCNDCKIG